MADLVMTGTPSQIEWADQIKPLVDIEFDRVVHAFSAVGEKQNEPDRSETAAVIALVEEKRRGVMARREAGYFIRDWRELGDQVRRMIAADDRYQTIQAARAARTKGVHGKS